LSVTLSHKDFLKPFSVKLSFSEQRERSPSEAV